MRAFLSKDMLCKLQVLQQWSQLRQEQPGQAIRITKDAVLSYLKRQIERGNWQAVREVLKGKPMTQAGRFLLGELRDKIVQNLILRLGLRKVIAVGLAAVLLPLVLAKVAGELLRKMGK